MARTGIAAACARWSAAIITTLALASGAWAVDAPVYKHGGTTQPAIGVFCLDLAGNYTGCGGGGGGTGGTVNQGTAGSQTWLAAPAPSASYSTQRTTGIGTTAVLVSAADTTNRRTVLNMSSTACELVQSGAAYGTGHPIPAGDSFTFDAGGRTTAAIYVACAAAGGSVSVLSY